ncbi:hypothetical protein EDM56_00285 [Brevibacillus fluminis]|uniref:DUF5317 domain-containing protein n=1 Tax=Brevibacillus fluminis TaxID=511487 RepID=A0A3M8DWR2_9BACL|nr:DUF5317 domain-containing protein [Brevibacillus fluminis]RNB92623.1 hypothetical protein EDM56_00285 [Brevibacillus fluminis]
MLDVVVVSFVIAFLRRGRIREMPQFHSLWALGISILLQIGSAFVGEYAGLLVSISYVFTLLFFYSNREHEDMRIFMIGWLLNALVIWANYGRMPVDLEQATKVPFPLETLIAGTDFKHVLLNEETNLPFLADFIYKPFYFKRVISIGDLFVILGTFLLVQRIMNKPLSLIRLREGKQYAPKH